MKWKTEKKKLKRENPSDKKLIKPIKVRIKKRVSVTKTITVGLPSVKNIVTSNLEISCEFVSGVVGGFTGSSILLSIKQGKSVTKILVDAGLVQGNPRKLIENNQAVLQALNPKLIDLIILTHAHGDHVGLLPALFKHGFRGRIFCTEATADFLKVVLEEGVKIQAETVRRKLRLRGKKPLRNLVESQAKFPNKYDEFKTTNKYQKGLAGKVLGAVADVDKTCDLIKNDGFKYQEWIKLFNGCSLKFYESGHMLGGAICVLHLKDRLRKDIYLGFSGDLGRGDSIILPPSAKVREPLDYWFTESTNGGIKHPKRDQEIRKLLTMIRGAVEKKQKVIIPSSVLEKSQELVYLLSHHMAIGDIPKIDIYLDSPMGIKILDIYASKWGQGLFADQGKLTFNPFNQAENKFLKTVLKHFDSECLIAEPGPYIVIAGSNTCNFGRVVDHLRASLSDSNTVVCLVGYMPRYSLGDKLKRGDLMVNIDGKKIAVKAKMISADIFSAHADGPFLVSYAKSLNYKFDFKVFITHGDEKNARFLKKSLMNTLPKGRGKIVIPKINQKIIL